MIRILLKLLVLTLIIGGVWFGWQMLHQRTDAKPPITFGTATTFQGIIIKQGEGVRQKYVVTNVAAYPGGIVITNGNDLTVQQAVDPLLNQHVELYGAMPPDKSPNLLLMWVSGRLIAPGPTIPILDKQQQYSTLFNAYIPTQQDCVRKAMSADHLSTLLTSSTTLLTADDLKIILTCITDNPPLKTQ